MKDSTLTVYPTALKVTDQLVRMARTDCVLGQRVTTLPQVVDALWRESADARTALSEAGERLMVLETLALSASDAGCRLSADPALAMIRQFKSAGLTATDCRAACDALASGATTALESFVTVFAGYERLLSARSLADRHDREAAALAMLHRAERERRRPQYLEGVERLVVAEIYDLSLLQFMIIAALIRLIGDARLTIQAEPHRVDASRFADLTWSRFASEESIADQVLPEFVRRTGRPGRLGFLLEHLFTGNYPSPPEPDRTVRILPAANPRIEAEAVAYEVRRLVEGPDAAAPDRIAIVARDLTLYRDYLAAALARHGIPLAVEGSSLRASSPARALLQALAIPLADYRREELLALCSSPYAKPGAAQFPTLLDEVGYLDRSTRSFAESCAWRRRKLADSSEGAMRSNRSSFAGRSAWLERGAAAWQDLLDALAALETPATLAGHLQRLAPLFTRLRFDFAAGNLIGPGAAAAAALERTLDELADDATRAAPDRLITLREFRETLEAVLSETPVPATGAADGAARALSLRDARGLDFDYLFVLGLNDGVFPHYHREDPIIPDQTAIGLNRSLRGQLRRRFGDRAPDAPGAILRTTSQRNSEEPFLFFLALSMPARGAMLSYSAADANGRPLGRSPFLDEVSQLLGSPEVEQAGSDGVLTSAGARASRASIQRRIAIERERARYFALPSREEQIELDQQAVKAGGQGRKKDKIPSEFRWTTPQPDSIRSTQAGPYDGRICANAEWSDLFCRGEAPWRWSATQLSELASCGFKFFAARILRMRDEDELDYTPSRAEAGNLAHQVLSAYFSAGPDFSQPEEALRLAAEVANRIRPGARNDSRDPTFFDLEWATIRTMLEEVVHYEIACRAATPAVPGARPTQIRHEHDFGLTLDVPQASAEGPIALQGSIDRLELQRAPDGRVECLTVKDYKTSRSLDRLADLVRPDKFASSDMQLPVYLLAAAAEFRAELAPGAEVRASYIALKNREKETNPVSILVERLGRTVQDGTVAGRIGELVSAARSGRFDVDPLECADWCPYRSVCRTTRGTNR